MTFNNEKNLVLGRDNFLFFYDIFDISNPKLLSKTNFNNENSSLDSGYITNDMKYIVLSADTEGMIIAYQIYKILFKYPKYITIIHNQLRVHMFQFP